MSTKIEFEKRFDEVTKLYPSHMFKKFQRPGSVLFVSLSEGGYTVSAEVDIIAMERVQLEATINKLFDVLVPYRDRYKQFYGA